MQRFWLAVVWCLVALGGAFVVIEQAASARLETNLSQGNNRFLHPLKTNPLPIPDRLAGAIVSAPQQVRFSVNSLAIQAAGLELTTTGIPSAAEPIRRVELVVTGPEPVLIEGPLETRAFPQADVWLIAPHGITFGKNARLNVGQSFFAIAGKPDGGGFRFFSQHPGSLVNHAQLQVGTGKTLALLGGHLEQRGTLYAPGGTIVVAAPVGTKGAGSLKDKQNLMSPEFPLASFSFERGKQGGAAGILEQLGTIDVSGETGGAITIAGGLGLLGGEIRADARNQGGTVRLTGEHLTLTGMISASGSKGNGGNIRVETSTRTIQTSGSLLTVAGGQFGNGGEIALRSGTTGKTDGIFLSGTLAAGTAGLQGGSISLAGRKLDVVDGKLFAVGPTGGGTIRVGTMQEPGAADGAETVFVSPTSEVRTDSTSRGNGGEILVWSRMDTEMRGTISAAGGPQGGDGGQMDVSGLGAVTMNSDPATPAGKPGRLRLDPKNIVVSDTAGVFPQYDLVNPHPGTFTFGERVTVTGTGHLAVSNRNAIIGASAAGAVYLFHGLTGALISVLTGSSANDSVGNGGFVALTNGNYVVRSPNWNNPANGAGNAGAATWGSGVTGVSGFVSASNSLVGGSFGDNVSQNSIRALTNGNYVVVSTNWDNPVGSISDAGAVTWGNGASGSFGVVTAANSLVGTTANDFVGNSGVTPLANGNYVVGSQTWDNPTGPVDAAGAITWCDGTTGRSGPVTAANSLYGGTNFDQSGSGGIVALSNGNYVVASRFWDNPSGSLNNAGAVTWGNGTTGITGLISATNSLVGTTGNDAISAGGVVGLTNGNYVVCSPLWSNGGTTPISGAATWCDGTTGRTGPINASNSLIGTKVADLVGSGAIALSNGNYVVRSDQWDAPGGTANVGAVTWGDGAGGTFGPVSSANSLVGTTANDQLGSGSNGGITALANGHFVVRSPAWSNAGTANAGAVTWCNGETAGPRTVGAVSPANSLVGSTAGDKIGEFSVTALTNGNFVVNSPSWSNSGMASAGASTWCNGSTAGPRTVGPVSVANSLTGSAANHQVGSAGAIPLTNGNYAVSSPGWDNGAVANVGAVTWGNGVSGSSGPVGASNSLMGTSANDGVGNLTALPNGNFVIRTGTWDKPGQADAGAVTWGNGTTGQSLTGFGELNAQNSVIGNAANTLLAGETPADGVNGYFAAVFQSSAEGGKITLGLSNPDPNQMTYSRGQGSTMTVTTGFLTSLLNVGTPVTLQASNDITLNSPLTASGGGDLTLQAGRSVLLNQPVSLANGNLTVIANDLLSNGVVDTQRDAGQARITATGAISTGTGTATFEIRTGAGKTNLASGVLQLLTVQAGGISLSNNGPSAGSQIRVTGTIGSGPCSGASLCAANGGGGIAINHPNSSTNFLVGNAAANGTAGSLVSATATVQSPLTIINAPGTFTQGNINVTPGLVCPTISITPATLPGGIVGTTYSQTLTGTPAASYGFSLLSGNLPPGIALEPNGNLTGTPTQAGVFNFTIRALNDTTTCSGAQALTLTVLARPNLTAGPVANRQQGSSGTIAPIATVSDVETPAGNLTVTALSIPTGISVTGVSNQNGTVTATIEASCTATLGNNTVGLQVTDGDGLTATASLTVTVTANESPTLTYTAAGIGLGGSRFVNPATGPSDTGVISSLTLQSQGTFTGTVGLNSLTGVVTLSNAGPAGTHTIVIRATDNCGSVTNATLDVSVAAATHTVTQFYPVASTSGKTVTISGTGFVPGNTMVFFGEGRLISATVTNVTATSITVTVPASAAGNLNGYLTVRVNGVDVTTLSLAANAPDPGNPAAVFPEFVLWGDVNRDGVFGTNDVALARAFLQFQATPTARQVLAADVVPANANGSRGNGQLSTTDFSLLRAVSFGQTSF
ncbi:MAG: filamentous hemagglutinin N-terminal domain-containing protein [Blastocatellia bacterium]|nr:filamentous hemagglutinin N-terminal domain-containing protein [Blastocatellia bacterium]